jgi:hypothetical protein
VLNQWLGQDPEAVLGRKYEYLPYLRKARG